MASAKQGPMVLDTHVFLGLYGGTGLGTRSLRKIDAAREGGMLYIAAMTPWEIAMLASRGSIRLQSPKLQFITEAVHATGVQVHPLDPGIAVDSVELRGFHGDPADRIIVATTRHLRATLVTRDTKILEWAAETEDVNVLEP